MAPTLEAAAMTKTSIWWPVLKVTYILGATYHKAKVPLSVITPLWVKAHYFLSFSISACWSCPAIAKTEVGGGIGGWCYSGDIVRKLQSLTSKPAVTVFYRRNLSKAGSFKAGLTFGKIGACDNRKPIDKFAVKRDQSFNLTLMEFSGTYEYHFIDWRDDIRRNRLTPHLFAWRAVCLLRQQNQTNRIQQYASVHSFGGGIKYVLNRNGICPSLASENIFDYLDNISGSDLPYKTCINKANPFDNDTYWMDDYITLSNLLWHSAR